jgi:hypothetical protein
MHNKTLLLISKESERRMGASMVAKLERKNLKEAFPERDFSDWIRINLDVTTPSRARSLTSPARACKTATVAGDVFSLHDQSKTLDFVGELRSPSSAEARIA